MLCYVTSQHVGAYFVHEANLANIIKIASTLVAAAFRNQATRKSVDGRRSVGHLVHTKVEVLHAGKAQVC